MISQLYMEQKQHIFCVWCRRMRPMQSPTFETYPELSIIIWICSCCVRWLSLIFSGKSCIITECNKIGFLSASLFFLPYNCILTYHYVFHKDKSVFYEIYIKKREKTSRSFFIPNNPSTSCFCLDVLIFLKLLLQSVWFFLL